MIHTDQRDECVEVTSAPPSYPGRPAILAECLASAWERGAWAQLADVYWRLDGPKPKGWAEL